MRIEPKQHRFWKRVVPPAIEALGSSLIIAASAVGTALECSHLIKPPAPKTLPPDLLKDQSDVKMERPLLLVPGYNTTTDRFNQLTAKLVANGGNGGQTYFLNDGKVYLDHLCQACLPAIPPEAKVFVIVLDQSNDAPPASAPQLKTALEQIQQATATPKVDVAAYSLGGLASRHYRQGGDEIIGKLMFVGTPHRGSKMAEAARRAIDLSESGWPVQWVMERKPLKSSDREALNWLVPPQDKGRGAELTSHNSAWEQQIQGLEKVISIGSAAKKTVDNDFLRVPGDDMVTVESLGMPGLKVELLDNPPYPSHRYLFSNPEVLTKMKDFFEWGGA